MKLRNKKTGEIIDLDFANIKAQFGGISVIPEPAVLGSPEYVYTSLVELNKEWEDVQEEPKAFGWRIDEYNEPEEIGFGFSLEELEYLKEIGLWFETKEETELAVRKLRAWKRLKDKGFRFGGWKRDKRFYGDYTIDAQDYTTCDDADLDLLFGGEE